MKKVIALLLVSALVSVATFAQGVTTTTVAAPAAPELVISGLVETGLKYASGKIGDAGTLELFDEDDAELPLRADLSFAYDAPAFGLFTQVRFDYEGALGIVAVPFIYNAYAYLNLFDKAAVIKVGKMTEETLLTPGDDGFLDIDPSTGTATFPGYAAALVVTPVTGLNLFYGILVDPAASIVERDVLGEFIVGAKFSLDKVFDVIVGFERHNNMDLSYLGVGFALNAIEGFSFAAEAAIPTEVATTQIAINEVLGVTIDKLGIGLIAYQYIKNGDLSADSTFSFNPSVSYDFGGVVAELGFTYDTIGTGQWEIHPKATVAVAEGATVVSGIKIGTAEGYTQDDVGLIVYSSFQFEF